MRKTDSFYLQDILEAIERIEEYLIGIDYQTFDEDLMR